MAGPNAQPGAGEASPHQSTMVPDAENASWAALQKELEGDDALFEESPPEPQRREPEPPARARAPKESEGEGDDGEPKPKPTYDELEGNNRNITVALRQARQAEKDAREQEKDAREQLTRFNAVMEEVRARRQQPEPQQPPAPKEISVDEDPIGFFKQELAKRDAVIQQLQHGTQESVQQVRQQQETNAFIQHVERSEIAMRGQHADYDQACEHLELGRIAELEIMLPDTSPQAAAMARQAGLPSPAHLRAAMLNNDRINVARQAVQLGISPAELYYSLAKQRGYTGKVAPRANGKQQAAPTQAEQVIETARRGQKAAKSVGGGSGDADNDLNVADLADLYEEDPEAFDAAWEKMARTGKLG